MDLLAVWADRQPIRIDRLRRRSPTPPARYPPVQHVAETSAITYRSFRNSDPPALVALWHDCELGRGAASGFSYDALEFLNFSQRYFDPNGFIVAVEEGSDDIVGFVHAGFGPNEDFSALTKERGAICAIMVRPQFRGLGVGRELLSRAEAYLRDNGATELIAGPAPPFDPFYIGLYGGSRPTGFLESDPDAEPFLTKLGYEPAERYFVLQRDIVNTRDPLNFRLVNVRRKMKLSIAAGSPRSDWWWMTRYGRLETLRFLLEPKSGGESVASVTVIGLDLYLQKWHQRVVGLIDLNVNEDSRRKGYAQTLLTELCKRLRDEMVTLVEAHVSESNTAALKVFEYSGFEKIDTGVVYRKQAE
ncbi:putative acetyltransferase [Stratiformator vulcanicus]|uniref:Putative acetyltransferase n=2 Tax=Stratiformator vulcanicus TaxID=2527980 RepID=A0A517QXS6_9PLAN|nr:putative acetyltransferase [Stratiformator vulcanicus]